MSERHCETCICGRRAPVQSGREAKRGSGTITWAEHLEAYSGYSALYGKSQSAERLAERGGFSYGELQEFLGHDPKAWITTSTRATRTSQATRRTSRMPPPCAPLLAELDGAK